MQKIIVDTNVLVSSLIQRSYPYLIVKEIFSSRTIQLCVSKELLHEYYEVLNRKKFSKYPDFIFRSEALIADIIKKSTLFHPKIKLEVIDDVADNRLLELANESNAEFLITGNTNDFTMEQYDNTKIISPKDYYENFARI